MRPPYYLFYYRDYGSTERPHETNQSGTGRFALITCSIVMAGLIAVAFLSGW